MSIIKSIKQVLGLGPAAESHHWDGSVPNQLSLKRGTPEAPGAELIKALDGVLSFPNQGQSLVQDGYIKLPGGLIVQWGGGSTTTGGTTHSFPIPFPNNVLRMVGSDAGSATVEGVAIGPLSASQYTARSLSGSPGFAFIAIGH